MLTDMLYQTDYYNSMAQAGLQGPQASMPYYDDTMDEMEGEMDPYEEDDDDDEMAMGQ